MRRRTKPRVVWLPQSNANTVDSATRNNWHIATVALNNTSGAAAAVLEVPIVHDGGGVAADPLNPATSLADLQVGYRLRRIVGKIYCFLGQSQTTQQEDIYGITAGFIIRRVATDTGLSLASGVAPTQIDPADIDNTADPWIWRRSWILSNGPDSGSAGPTPSSEQFDVLTTGEGGHFNFGKGYPGGNVEGPHVDQKTARLVGPEERLFLDVSGTPLIAAGQATTLVVIYEFRVLASMRQSIGNRRNASR